LPFRLARASEGRFWGLMGAGTGGEGGVGCWGGTGQGVFLGWRSGWDGTGWGCGFAVRLEL